MNRLLVAVFMAAFFVSSAYAAQLSPQGPFRALDSNGDPCSACKLYTYEAGTSTPKTTYTDVDEGTANANPTILDSDGYADVWLADGAYKLVLKDSADATVWTIDDVAGSSANAFGDVITAINSTTNLTATYENNLIVTTGGPTLNVLSASTAGEGFTFAVYNNDANTTTIDANGTETINGSLTKTLPGDGQWTQLYSDGSNWVALSTPISATEAQITFTSATNLVYEDTGSLHYSSAASVFDVIYPVGSIYISTSSTDPSVLFGGTWTQLEDQMLMAAGSTYTAASTGGSATHTISEANLPSSLTVTVGTGDSGNGNYVRSSSLNNTGSASVSLSSVGSGSSINHLPPYIAVYVWERTS